ncbi:MAG: hypothetical protein LVQ96_05530 [Thermoplasmatales archaeon]|nr:hypothetical protein [Thermoplasmatales archaeon]MCW6170613.1 hypothetical protein [Thermoplasmatales archaeon]
MNCEQKISWTRLYAKRIPMRSREFKPDKPVKKGVRWKRPLDLMMKPLSMKQESPML